MIPKGTSWDCVANIAQNGFNRAYGGRHGSKLGRGAFQGVVYMFAHVHTASLNVCECVIVLFPRRRSVQAEIMTSNLDTSWQLEK